jgi:transcriptional regulator with XRE-family HTH domain
MIGENIKRIRSEKGLTQKELAQMLGVTAATVQRYETEKIACKSKTIEKLIEVLGITINDLYGIGTKEVEPIAILELIICMEELAELQKEISKYSRGRSNKESIIEEIADVIISIDKIKDIIEIDNAEIKKVLKEKLARNTERRKEGRFY